MGNETFRFEKAFAALTGSKPFPWQEGLYEQFRQGRFPVSCNIPTGLGKTNVIVIWLIALANGVKVPRRLVYVVNRRTVVDQTTNEVVKLRDNAGKIGIGNLAISTLRGQFADNREWSADPARPAVICGTVDMIGSRLLFSGYGVGFKAKPLHAGFLGQDALVVHDEAHLEPAFQDLLIAIEKEQRRGRFPDRHPLRVMELSATSRKEGEVFGLTDKEKHADFGNADAPEELRTVWKRTHAKKTVTLHPVREKKELADKLAQLALTHENSGRAILIFVQTVENLCKVVAKLPKDQTRQLTGTMRGFEREKLINEPIFKRFLPRAEDVEDQTVYLVCTSAGEVGVNISADHMVCDLSTFESMAQRFGRVNRFGLRDDTRIDIVCPETFDENDKLSPARQKTLDLLRQLDGNASPDAMDKLDPKARTEAFAPLPVILPTSDILFDAWSMTSIRDRMPGRPLVEPYLHGIRDYELPETQIAWREEVGVITGDLLNEYPPEDLLDEYPLKPHELLSDRSDRVHKELAKLADRFPNMPTWVIDDFGKVTRTPLNTLAEKSGKERLEGKTILLPHNVGGLTPQGLLDGSCPSPEAGNDVADVVEDKEKHRLRRRVWNDDSDFDEKTVGMRLILRIDFPPEDDEDAERRSWHWFELPLPKENSKNAAKPVLLDVHVSDVVKRARAIVANLELDDWIKNAIILAAMLHDLGKRRELWQRSIGRPTRLAEIWFGKSGRRWKPRYINDCRHEFGSLVDLQSVPEFQSLDDDSKDLVQHLIAAHHGQGRPHFAPEQIIDPHSTTLKCETIAVEVPRRFARLQRRFGRWGLAYLESILRAADWAASAEPSEFFAEEAK